MIPNLGTQQSSSKREVYCSMILKVKVLVTQPLRPHGLGPTRLLCPWDSLGKNTGVGCHALLQGIFLIQGLNPGLLNFRQIPYHLSHQTSPIQNYLRKQKSQIKA